MSLLSHVTLLATNRDVDSRPYITIILKYNIPPITETSLIILGLNLLHGTLLRLPVEPAPGVLADVFPAGLAGEGSGGAGADSGFAIDEQLDVLGGPVEAVGLLEVLVGDMEALDGGGDGDVDGAGDLASFEKLDGFADVCSGGSEC